MIDEVKKHFIKQQLVSYLEENYFPVRRSHRYASDSFSNMMSEECCVSTCSEEHHHRNIDDLLKQIDFTFQESVFFHIDNKHLDEVEVYNRAHLDRRLFSKIRSNKDYKPNKKTAICLCFGLKLNIDEALDLLEKAGYTLSNSSKFDMIVRYFLETEEYDINLLNNILYDYKLKLLVGEE